MRRCLAVLALFGLAVSTARADDCSSAVQASFEKQRAQKGYRLTARQQTNNGVLETERSFLSPDRMYNKIVVPGEPAPLETIAVGRWAWANQGAGWQELQPQFAQSVTFEVSNTLQTPVEIKDPFVCLGKVTRDGKEYVGYRTSSDPAAGKPGEPPIARTVLVDPASGLPSYNMVGPVGGDTAPIIVTVYEYPSDLTVEAPLDALPASPQH